MQPADLLYSGRRGAPAGYDADDEPWTCRDLGFHGCVVVMMKLKIAGDKIQGVGRIDRQRITGLACLAADVDTWSDFERKWWQVLGKHGRKSSHMSADHSDDNSFTEDRLRVIQQFIKDKEKVCTAISVVRLEDYEQGYSATLPRHTCLNTYWCLDQICKQFPEGKIDFVFDQGEPFFNEVNQHLTKKSKNFIRQHRMLSRISALTKASSDCYSVQAADFLAWQINRQRTDLPWAKAGTLEVAMAQLPAYDPNPRYPDTYKPHPEGLRLLMTTKNKLWVHEDFEYFVQCARGQNGEVGEKFIEPYSLCMEK